METRSGRVQLGRLKHFECEIGGLFNQVGKYVQC